MDQDLLICDRGTCDVISAILQRLREAFSDVSFDVLSLSMDLTACSNRGHVDLAALLKARIGDLAHDVAGIAQHLDRETGDLGECFMPRCRGKKS